MNLRIAVAAGACVVTGVAAAAAALLPDPPAECANCAALNRPHQPYRIYGNTYYVGVAGLSSILIDTNQGLILLDGDLPQSTPLIAANIARLGFRLADVKLIGNSHAHFDHAGGLAALQRATGAEVIASAKGAEALQHGAPPPDDPQFASHGDFPAVQHVRVVADGDSVRLGDVALTAHYTPGHTPGGTTWTWQSCEAGRCLNVVYADSLTAVSSAGFRFSGDTSHPDIVAEFRGSISKVANLPCDILLSPHPNVADLDGKLGRRKTSPGTNPFIDPGDCRRYAARAGADLDKRVAEERTRVTDPGTNSESPATR
jgi:metallo-beta-lactamase class B